MNVKISYAFDAKGQLIKIDDAEKKGKYYCPLCNNPVIVRKGDIRVHHYSHKISEICSQESAIHKIAKLLIQKLISDWKKGSISAPIINRTCFVCNKPIPQPLPDKVEKAELEVKLSNGSIVDVVLLGSDIPLAGIEVRVSHKVDEIKKNSLPIPFIEVDGFRIIENQNPIDLLVDYFNPITCNKCKKILNTFNARSKKVSEDSKIPIPETFYRYAIIRCWKCGKKILVFTWPNQSSFDQNPPQRNQKPKTIQYRFSKTVKDYYWVNCCPYCNMIQGDFFLYHDPNSPFFCFNCGDDTVEDFRKDMMIIASRNEYY